MNRRMDQIENELRMMKKELSLATDAEEKSRKAMDDLASVLREVAADASETKERLKSTQAELKAANAEKEQLKLKLSSVMGECNKCKHEVERLKMEADETLSAWNEKESGLVGCMKKLEEDRTREQERTSALQEEMRKLRDILKQAMSEAVGAQEAATLARAENFKLKDLLSKKDTSLNFMSRELESLRLSEASARDALKDSKRKADMNTQNAIMRLPDDVDHDKEYEKVAKSFSFDMRCIGKNRRFEDLVDEKAMVRGGSNLNRVERHDNAINLKRNMSSRFADNKSIVDAERRRIDQRQDSLRNKALVKKFGQLLGSKSSKSSY